ncbi:MAG: response regulator [Xanthomonadaceae bacterium]|jgi:twitching motility two-component system response regulator PilH|nr:response regulator [Xanthomonadaceae bacterium]
MSKILVCDDSPAELANLRAILTAAGHHTVTATNGAEALDKATAEKPHLILMDIVMPDMDGYEACRRLQADPATKTIPVVFVSSKNQRADHMWAKMQGARMLISKPYTQEQIAEVLKAFG